MKCAHVGKPSTLLLTSITSWDRGATLQIQQSSHKGARQQLWLWIRADKSTSSHFKEVSLRALKNIDFKLTRGETGDWLSKLRSTQATAPSQSRSCLRVEICHRVVGIQQLDRVSWPPVLSCTAVPHLEPRPRPPVVRSALTETPEQFSHHSHKGTAETSKKTDMAVLR